MASFLKSISLLNVTRTTTSTTYTSTADREPLWHYLSADYDGVNSVKFSVVMRAASGDTAAMILSTNSGTDIAGAEVTTTSTTNVNVLSGDIYADLTDATDYRARWKRSAGSGTESFDGASILISQTNPTKTVTVIEMGEVNNTTSSTYLPINTTAKPGHAFLYESDKWDGTVEIFLEADIRPRTDTTNTMYAELYNYTDSASVTEVTHTGDTTITRKRSSAVSMTTAKEYILRSRVGSGASGGDIASGKVIIKQTNFTKTLCYIPILTTVSSGTETSYTAQNRLFTFNASDFVADTKTFYYEASLTVTANTGYSKLYNVTDSADISELTSTNTAITVRTKSTALTMPTDASNVLGNYRKIDTSGTVKHARSFLIVELVFSTSTNVTVSSTVTSITSSILSPIITAIKNISTSTTAVNITSSVISPTISTVRNINIVTNTQNLLSSIVNPVVTAVINISVSVSEFNSIFSIITPSITVTSDTTISPSTLTTTLEILSPTISTTKNISISAVTSNSVFEILQPVIQTTSPNVTVYPETGVIGSRDIIFIDFNKLGMKIDDENYIRI